MASVSRLWPASVRGVFVVAVIAINTLFWCLLLFLLAVARLALPMAAWQGVCARGLGHIAEAWIAVNTWMIRWISGVRVVLEGDLPVASRESVLVLCNHQSWMDILLLQTLCNRHLPLLRFFLKRALIWVPVLGLAWWALDFPFMHRYSRAYLVRHPERAGHDLEATRRACRKFERYPVAIMIFPEGTRYSRQKAEHQSSSFRHLLQPRAGGLIYVLAMLGEQIHGVYDFTIQYPGEGSLSLWAFLSGRRRIARIGVRHLLIPDSWRHLSLGDGVRRAEVIDWFMRIWHEKDNQLEAGAKSEISPPAEASS